MSRRLPRRSRAVALGLALLVSTVSAGCGGGHSPAAKPPAVPDGLVPDQVQGGFAFSESQLDDVKKSFANAGANSLVADGRLWELRKADRLVGILQLSTVVPELDLGNKNHRDQLISQVMPTVRDQILVGDVVVFTSAANHKNVFLWFSKNMFSLLTIKAASEDQIDPEGVATEVVDHEAASPSWKPLYIDDGGDL